MFQCTIDHCGKYGDKLSMERHYMTTHMVKNCVPFSCSVCDFVATKEKDVQKHDKWYKPHKTLQVAEFKVIKGEGDGVIALKRWEATASLTHWLGQMKEKKTEKEPPVEDITSQLLEEVNTDEFRQDDNFNDQEESKPTEETETALIAKEKALDEKLKKIDEVFKMVSEIYRNGPMRGLTPIPNREPTPPLKRKERSQSRSPRRPSHQEWRQKREDRLRRERIQKRVQRQREERWRRANTLFRDGERHRSTSLPKMRSVVKVIRK